MRLFSLLAVLIAFANHAHAQCAADDYEQRQTLPDPPDLAVIVGVQTQTWSDIAELLGELEQRARADGTPALQQLANTLATIRTEFDGTAANARYARLDSLLPHTCGMDGEFPKCAWDVLDGKVEVPIGDKDGWTCESKTRFARYLVDAHAILNRIIASFIKKTSNDLNHFAAQWKRYAENGYSQYPHEIWINGGLFLDTEAWGPPGQQLIAFHPAVGFGTDNLRKEHDGSRAAAFVLSVEAVGYVKYLADFRHHIGVSVAASLPNFEWNGVGIGPILHFDGFGIGYNFGLKHDKPDTLFVMFDVTRAMDDSFLLAKAKERLRDRLN